MKILLYHMKNIKKNVNHCIIIYYYIRNAGDHKKIMFYAFESEKVIMEDDEKIDWIYEPVNFIHA